LTGQDDVAFIDHVAHFQGPHDAIDASDAGLTPKAADDAFLGGDDGGHEDSFK
jgi:hypothetical protein